MFKNYLITAFRNVLRHKGYSAINVIGLAVGMAVCILIMLWVQDELSYDRFHTNARQIYRVVAEYYDTGQPDLWWKTPPPLARGLKDAYPEIAGAAMYGEEGREWLVTARDKSFMESGLAFAEPEFLDMFTLSFVKGDSLTALSSLSSIIITESVARKYFGNENPIDQAIQIDRQFNFTVAGVIKDLPYNSHLRFQLLASFPAIEQFWEARGMLMDLNGWNISAFATYVMLQEGGSLEDFNQKIRTFLASRSDDTRTDLYLQPLTDIHLRSDGIQPALGGQGDIAYVYIFSVIAVFVLVIACINFMNLTTARAAGRAKEVGLRKAVGAQRTQLIRQFFSESMSLTLLSMFLALGFVELFLPSFGKLTGKVLSPDLTSNLIMWGGAMAVFSMAGIMAGLYPALFLSSFQPARVLKGTLRSGGKSGMFRRALVITQFTLSILLMVCTLVVSKQLYFMQNRKLGFDKDHVLYLPNRGNLTDNLETIRNELLKIPGISDVTASSNLPTQGIFATTEVDWEGKEPKEPGAIGISSVDYDYIKTFGMEILEGRGFSRSFLSDSNSLVLNEAAVQKMGMASPLGKKAVIFGREGTIIGIARNYHYMSMREEIKPLILTVLPDVYRYIFIRTKPGDISQTVAKIEAVWAEFLPEFPFEFHFLDEDYDQLYKTEKRIGRVLTCFTILAIGISCLGMFGLAAFMAEQRTKEIGVRKIMGSSVSGIILLLTQEFVKWVLISYVIALPVSYYVMHNWLQRYAYRTHIGIQTFILAAVLAVVITVITVGYQAFRAACVNPVDSLKYE